MNDEWGLVLAIHVRIPLTESKVLLSRKKFIWPCLDFGKWSSYSWLQESVFSWNDQIEKDSFKFYLSLLSITLWPFEKFWATLRKWFLKTPDLIGLRCTDQEVAVERFDCGKQMRDPVIREREDGQEVPDVSRTPRRPLGKNWREKNKKMMSQPQTRWRCAFY